MSQTGQLFARMRKVGDDARDRMVYLKGGISQALTRIDSFPEINDQILSELLTATQIESFFSGQNIMTQGDQDGTFFVLRRTSALPCALPQLTASRRSSSNTPPPPPPPPPRRPSWPAFCVTC